MKSNRILRVNMRGEDVKRLRTQLRQLGYKLKGVIDRFDTTTRQAVQAFQNQHKLEPTGEVDERTARALTAAIRPHKSREKPKRYVISGHVLDRATGQGIAGLRVEAWDKDARYDDLVASAVTEGDGRFQLDFDDTRFREMYPEAAPDLYFKVYRGLQLLRSTEDSVLWNLATGKTSIRIEVDLPGEGTEDQLPQQGYVVRGRVLQPDGQPLAGVTVKAFDRDLRQELLLGKAITGNDGSYSISYTTSKFSRTDKDGADLLVRAYDQKSREIATSQVIVGAASEQVLDLVKGNEEYCGLSEYEQLQAKLTPLLQKVKASELKQEDITYLAGKTGLDPMHIVYYAKSKQLEQRSKISAGRFYALFRAGLPTDLPGLLAQDAGVQQKALETALRDNLIPKSLVKEPGQAAEEIRAGLAGNLYPESGGEQTPLRSLVGTVLRSAKLETAFLNSYLTRSGTVEAFWKELEEDTRFKGRVDDLRFTLQVGALTGNHLPLVKELQNRQKAGELSSLKSLVQYDEADWMEMIKDDAIGIPASVPGKGKKKQASNYAKALANAVEDSFPTAFIAARIKQEALPAEEGLISFLENNQKFDLTTTRLETYLAEEGVTAQATVKQQLSALQRVYKVAPRLTQTRALMKDGLDSALAISRMSASAFTAQYAQTLGSVADANLIYENALQTTATALNLMANFGMRQSQIPVFAVSTATATQVDGIPDWQTLFGSLALCECEHCRSVYSPAAYLVDLLHFLKNRKLVDKVTYNSDGTVKSVTYKKDSKTNATLVAKDVLYKRRPDLGTIELTCENTNLPIPYVDLVNEILENFVAPLKTFSSFVLVSGTSVPSILNDLNNQKLSAAILDPRFVPALTEYATIRVLIKGKLWAIDDLAVSFTVHMENSQLKVTARNWQSSGTSEERAANPKYVSEDAYTKLDQQVFPWTLPFDLWVEEARAYLKHLGVNRYTLMETFRNGDLSTLLGQADIAHEHLGLSAQEAKLVNRQTTSQTGASQQGLWNLWGFQKSTLDSTSPIPDPSDSTKWITSGNWLTVLSGRVDVFLQQTGLTYLEMLQLLQIQYINPIDTTGTRKILIKSTDSEKLDTCEPAKLKLAGFDQTAAADIPPFIRLWQRLGWKMADLDRAVIALHPHAAGGGYSTLSDDLDDYMVGLSHAKRLHDDLKIAVESLLNFWVPAGDPLTQLWTSKCIDYSVSSRTEIPSLYAKLFRNKAVTNPLDKAFIEDPSGLSGTLSDHVATITAALGISATDFRYLLNDTGVIPTDATDPTKPDDKLTLDYLARLHRHVILAKALKLKTREYLSALKLTGRNPFASTLDTLLFVKQMAKVKASGFSITQLDYLLRHEYSSSSQIAPTEKEIALELDELRKGLKEVVADNTFIEDSTNPNGLTADQDGELTKKKLALLGWSDSLIAEVISTINDAEVYDAKLTSLASTIKFPAAFTNKVSYDTNNLKLRFTGVMTAQEKSNLISLAPTDTDFTTAVAELYNAPRTFVSRNMRCFDVEKFSYSPLSALPVSVTIPKGVEDKIYYDSDKECLVFYGAMTEKEHEALLKGSGGDSSYETAINYLYTAPDTSALQGDAFLSISGIGCDLELLFDSATSPAARFLLVLKRLLPYLKQSLSERLVVQKLGEALDLEMDVAKTLLTEWVHSPANPGDRSIDEFLKSSFVGSSKKVKLTAQAFQDQFDTYILLHKIALVISKAEITSTQLEWLIDYSTKADWYDLKSLPLTSTTPGAVAFGAWQKLTDLFKLRDSLTLGETVLDELFELAREAGPAATSAELNQAKEAYCDALIEATEWTEENVVSLIGKKDDCADQGALKIVFPDDFLGEGTLLRLVDCFALIKRLGMSAKLCGSLSEATVDSTTSRSAIQAVKAKYDELQWLSLARPLRNVLREKQRAALVAYLVANPPATGSSNVPTWRDENDVYAYFLIDVEMSPCQLTSRIKQAISSTQLFIQRCLMNLEKDISANSVADSSWEQWEWMKSYRVWEANRKVFLYPENWIEPELRDDKSPFFEDLESELIQNDLTDDTAEVAFLHYLEKMDTVGRLEIMGLYHQKEAYETGETAVDILHVFGRTRSTPHIYYYRQWVEESYWTAWEKLELEIEGDHLIPIVWNRRLYLFWPLFRKHSCSQTFRMPAGGDDMEEPKQYWSFQMAWSEYKNDAWSEQQITPIEINTKQYSSKELPDLSRYRFWAKVDESSGYLWIGGEAPKDWENNVEYLWEFCFKGCKSGIEYVHGVNVDVIPPPFTSSKNMSFIETGGGSDKLRMYGEGTIEQCALCTRPDCFNSCVKAKGLVIDTILDKTPGTYSLLLPHRYTAFFSQDSFFFQDDSHTFLVIPETLSPKNWYIDAQLAPGLVFNLPDRYLRSRSAHALDTAVAVVRPGDPPLRMPSSPVGDGARVVTRAGDILPRPSTVLNVYRDIGQLPDCVTSLPGGNGQAIQMLTMPLITDVADHSATAGRLLTADSNLVPYLEATYGQMLQASTYLATTEYLLFTFGKQYRLMTFYHPYICYFIKTLNRDGVKGLLRRDVQLVSNSYFETTYQPTSKVAKGDTSAKEDYPLDDVDFSYGGAYSLYNWELFFHAPLMIATQLSTNQQFEDAQKWFHYIFDPTDGSGLSVPQRYWRTRPFYETTDEQYTAENIPNLLRFLAKRGDAQAYAKLTATQKKELKELEAQVRQWRKKPFKPHVIARLRTTAYQKTVVMKYLDNLIAWGDQLFQRDTLESINEATQLYIFAAEILGKRPEVVPARAVAEVQTYDSIESKLDEFSNALVRIEEFVPPSTGGGVTYTSGQPQMTLPAMLYFCVPKNDELLEYWDTVADRLFKIRQCMNIEGTERQLALFEPPIDPSLLVKAAAAGVDLSSALNDISAQLPHYRFNVIAQKAEELCGELKSLGNALLSALEKRDAEALSLLRSTQEISLLKATRSVKEQQVDEAEEALDALKKTKELAETRFDYYSNLEYMISEEQSQQTHGQAAIDLQDGQMAMEVIAAVLHLIPNFKLGFPTTIGFTLGGASFASGIQATGAAIGIAASQSSAEGSLSGVMGGFKRRWDEWDFQKNLAEKEVEQTEKQIAAAEIRLAIAETELDNHDLQIKNAKAVDSFMRDKFTDRDLYNWMVGQIAGIYFKSYQLTYDLAKRAERAYRHELGLSSSSFIQFGYWDSLKKGLLAGERLAYDLKRMEAAYLDKNKREYEITKHVSLALLHPEALVQLREKGTCYVNLPEEIFDLDFPGHYMRRIKTVNLSIPCVTGPYASVNCTLTLLNNRTRKSTATDGQLAWTGDTDDERFTYNVGGVQSIVTSRAQEDSGLFEFNLRDERYLPFEGAGAVSNWKIELPTTYKQFDYNTIADVILHVRYTARQGGSSFKQAVESEITNSLNEMLLDQSKKGLFRMFSLKQEFSDQLHQFLNPTQGQSGKVSLNLAQSRFPYLFHDMDIEITTIYVYAKLKEGTGSSAAISVKLTPPGEANATTLDLESASVLGGLPNDSMTGSFTVGKYTLEEISGIDSNTIEDIGILLQYTVS